MSMQLKTNSFPLIKSGAFFVIYCKDEINKICGSSKIQKLIIEDAPYGHYDLKLKLDDGRIISVNKEQFLNAKEGEKCKNIIEN
jgi:hypothetical protein